MPERPGLLSNGPSYGLAWLLLCLAFVAHAIDEATTGFLDVYNATVLTLYGHFAWFPRLDLSTNAFLGLMIGANAVLLLLTPLAYRNSRALRPVAWLFAVVMFLNGAGHTAGTILGHTTLSVHFSRPAPGFYSSPLLFAASVYLAVRLRRTRVASAQPSEVRGLN